jgi:hypothetical protein
MGELIALVHLWPVFYTNFLSKLHRYAQSMISGYVGEEKA